jgi:hypothetical protein
MLLSNVEDKFIMDGRCGTFISCKSLQALKHHTKHELEKSFYLFKVIVPRFKVKKP